MVWELFDEYSARVGAVGDDVEAGGEGNGIQSVGNFGGGERAVELRGGYGAAVQVVDMERGRLAAVVDDNQGFVEAECVPIAKAI